MKKTIITALLALVALTGLGQETKTSIIKGHSPALKDGSVAYAYFMEGGRSLTFLALDTIVNGHFKLEFPVEGLMDCALVIRGEGCPNYIKTVFAAPGVVAEMRGEDCLYPMWKVESKLSEQATSNRITEHIRETLNKLLQADLANVPYKEFELISWEMFGQTLDILPSVPVDIASIQELEGICRSVSNEEAFPYKEQLKEVEKSMAARAPKGFEADLAFIHSLLYPLHILQPGDEAVDADFFDMQGRPHHLSELRGRYVLLDFWSLGCGPCLMAEPEMREAYEALNGRLEIVGINLDKPSVWQESDESKNIAWQNWSDGKMDKGGIERRYCDKGSIPYYVLLSPDLRVVWKFAGYRLGQFLGMAAALNGPRQDNVKNLQLAVSRVEAKPDGTRVTFRYHGRENYWFRIVGTSCIIAGDKRYKLTAADGITLDAESYPTENTDNAASSSLRYIDFTLTFEPFDTLPTSFDFIEGDAEGAFVIRNISLD